MLYQQLEFTCNPVGLLSSLLGNKRPHQTYRHYIWNSCMYPCILTSFQKSLHKYEISSSSNSSHNSSSEEDDSILQSSGDSSSDDSASSSEKKGLTPPLTFSSCHCHLQATLQYALTIFLFPLATLLGAGNQTNIPSSYRQ